MRARVVSVLVCVSCVRGGVGVGVPSVCVGVRVCVCGCVVGAGWGLLLVWVWVWSVCAVAGPSLGGVRWRRWCVVCGVWLVVCGVRRWCVGGVVAGVWCGWSLATPGGGSWVLLPATPGWVSLPVVVGVPRHSWLRVPGAVPRQSWLGSAGGGGVWCVVCGVWCVVCGIGLLVGLWLVCGVVGPSPLLAEVAVCYSPPLLAGFRCRWWWAVLATPGGGSRARFPTTPGWVSLSAVVCGVWCVVCGVWCAAVVCWWGCGLCLVWLVSRHSWRRFLCATPRHSWLGFAAGGGGRPSPLLAEGPGRGSPPLLAGVRWRRWCVVGLWLVCGVVWLVPCHSWRRFLCATPRRHSWLGFAAGGGLRFPATPGWGLLAALVRGVWCVLCGVRRWSVGGVVAGVWCGWSLATPGGGSCVLLPATPGWVSLPVVVGVPCHSWRRVPGAVPRHSWLGFAVGGGVWCVVCGVWCVVCGVRRWCVGGVLAGVWCDWSLATPGGGSCVLLPATPGWVLLPVVVGVPRHSWLRVPGAVPRHSWLGSAGGGGVWWGCG